MLLTSCPDSQPILHSQTPPGAPPAHSPLAPALPSQSTQGSPEGSCKRTERPRPRPRREGPSVRKRADLLNAENRTRAPRALPGPLPLIPPLSFDKATRSKKKGHLVLNHLVELLAEIGHKHGHGGRTRRASAEDPKAPAAVKTPAKPGLFRLAQEPTNTYLVLSLSDWAILEAGIALRQPGWKS